MCRRTTVFDPSTTGLERNLNKEALGANIKRIIEFLSLHNYRLIDPNIHFESNIKEDFPRIMHMLGYPTQFKKSAMNSINSPFNLPTFIAAIKWLTQVVDVRISGGV